MAPGPALISGRFFVNAGDDMAEPAEFHRFPAHFLHLEVPVPVEPQPGLIDGDGVVSFDEFVIVSKKFPNILFPAVSMVFVTAG